MEMLLASARNPLSIQQTAWRDEGATFQVLFLVTMSAVGKDALHLDCWNIMLHLEILMPEEKKTLFFCVPNHSAGGAFFKKYHL